MELIDMEEKNKTDYRSLAWLARKWFLSVTARLGLIKQTILIIVNHRHKEDPYRIISTRDRTWQNQPNNSIITIDSLQSLRLKIVKIQGDSHRRSMSVSITKHTPAYYTLCNIITLTIQKTIAVASITMITVDIVLERNGSIGTE